MKLQELIDDINFKDTLMKFGRMEISTPVGWRQFNYNDTLKEFSEWRFQHYSLDKYYKTFARFKKSLHGSDIEVNEIRLGTLAKGQKSFQCMKMSSQDFYKDIKNITYEQIKKEIAKERKEDITITYKDLTIDLVNNHTAFYIYELTPKFKQKVTVMSGADSKGYTLEQIKAKVDGMLEYLAQQGQ